MSNKPDLSLVARAGAGVASSCIGLFLVLGPPVGGLVMIALTALESPSGAAMWFHPPWLFPLFSYLLGAAPAAVTGLAAAAVPWRRASRHLLLVAAAGGVVSAVELLVLLQTTASQDGAAVLAGEFALAGATAGAVCTAAARRLFRVVDLPRRGL